MKLSHKSIILWNFYGWVQFNTGSMSWGLVVSPARSRTQGPEFVSPPCRIRRISLKKLYMSGMAGKRTLNPLSPNDAFNLAIGGNISLINAFPKADSFLEGGMEHL